MLGPLCQLKHGQIFFIYIYKFNILYLLFKYLIYLLKQDLAEYLRIVVNLKFIDWTEWPLRFHQFSSVTQSCATFCDRMDCNMPGFPVHHQLPEPAQTLVHWVSDAIQPFHPLSSPSPPAFNLSQYQGLFQRISSLHQVVKVGVSASASILPMNIQDWFLLGWTGWISLQSKGLSRVFSNTTVQKHQFFSTQLSL